MLGKPCIGVDCDGVIGDFVGYCLSVMSPRVGRQLVESDWTTWHTDGCLPECSSILAEIMAGGEFVKQMLPYPDAPLFLAALYPAHEVQIVTAVPQQCAWARFDWLLDHGLLLDGYMPTPTREKVARAVGLGMVAFVEDNADTAQAMADAGLLSVLIDRPWNRVPSPNVVRVANLDEAATFILEHAR